MRFVLILSLSLGMVPALGWAASVICSDTDRSVEITAKLNKSLGEPQNIQIKSGGKTKAVSRQDVSRVRSNANDFYLVFKVHAKSGREELELDTHFKSGARKASAGYLTNKTEKSERLPVSCNFTS